MEPWRPLERLAELESANRDGRLMRYWPEALLGFIAFIVYLQGLGTVSVWFDEAWSYGIANQPVEVLPHYLWGSDQNMALYYFLLHLWLSLLSVLQIPPTEFWLRLPSLICMALCVMVVYSFGARFFGRMAGLIAALLFLLNGWSLYAAQQARAYGLQLLLICLAWNALLIALTTTERRERRRMWVGYSAAITLAVYAHLFSLLLFAAQVALIALLFVLPGPWRARLRRSWRMAAVSLGAIVALTTPIVIDLMLHGGDNLFVPWAGASSLYSVFVILTQGTLNPYLWYLMAASALLAIVAAIVARIRRQSTEASAASVAPTNTPTPILGVLHRPGVGVLALVCWALAPAILSYLAALNGFDMQRYLLVIVPAISLLAGAGVAALRWRAAQVALGLLVIALMLNNLPHLLRTAQEQDFATGMAWLQREYHPGDGLACAPAINCSVPMAYYMDAHPGPARFDADSPGVWRFPLHSPTFSDLAALQRYAAKHQRLFFFTLRWTPGAPLDARTQEMQQWLASTYDLAGKVETPTGSIYLYVKAAGSG